MVRSDSLAHTLRDAGMHDTFRDKHPDKRAFTFFTGDGTASRLDSIWLLAPPAQPVLVKCASVLWGWARKVDHEPAVTDLLFSLPELRGREASPANGQWRISLDACRRQNRRAWRVACGILCNNAGESLTCLR